MADNSTSAVTFSAIPSTYSHLVLNICGKSTLSSATGFDRYSIQVNNVSSNYYYQNIYSDSSTGTIFGSNSGARAQIDPGRTFATLSAAGKSNTSTIWIPNYSNASVQKVLIGNTAVASDSPYVGVTATWGAIMPPTGAITSIYIFMQSLAFAQYTSFRLYGLRS